MRASKKTKKDQLDELTISQRARMAKLTPSEKESDFRSMQPTIAALVAKKKTTRPVAEEQLSEVSPAEKAKIDKLKEIGQKMKDVNNIFITGQKMKDDVLIAGARSKLAQLAKIKHDIENQVVDEDKTTGTAGIYTAVFSSEQTSYTWTKFWAKDEDDARERVKEIFKRHGFTDTVIKSLSKDAIKEAKLDPEVKKRLTDRKAEAKSLNKLIRKYPDMKGTYQGIAKLKGLQLEEGRQEDVVKELIAELGDKYDEGKIENMVSYLIAGGHTFPKTNPYYTLCKAACDKMDFYCAESVEEGVEIGGIKAKQVAGPGATSEDGIDEGWKSNLAGAALAGSMALGGAGAAHAAPVSSTYNISGYNSPEYDQKNYPKYQKMLKDYMAAHPGMDSSFARDIVDGRWKALYHTQVPQKSFTSQRSLDEELNEVKSGTIKNHPWVGKEVKTPDGIGTIEEVERKPTFSQLVPWVTVVWVRLPGEKYAKEYRKNIVRPVKVSTPVIEDNEGVDTIEMDVELFIRCLEWAKESAPDDIALHKFTENVVAKNGILTMDDYESLVPAGDKVEENKWDDDKFVGLTPGAGPNRRNPKQKIDPKGYYIVDDDGRIENGPYKDVASVRRDLQPHLHAESGASLLRKGTVDEGILGKNASRKFVGTKSKKYYQDKKKDLEDKKDSTKKDVEEGMGDIVKGIKRAIKGKASPEDVRRKYFANQLDAMGSGDRAKQKIATKNYNRIVKVTNPEMAKDFNESELREDASCGGTSSAGIATVVSGTPGIIKRTGSKKKGRYGNSFSLKALSGVSKGIYEAEEKKAEKFDYAKWKESGSKAKKPRGAWSEKTLLMKGKNKIDEIQMQPASKFVTIPFDVWSTKSENDKKRLKDLHPNLKVVGEPKPVKPPRVPKPKVKREPKPRIPRFKSAEPRTPLERKAKDAMSKVWQQIAPDVLSYRGAYEDYQNPYYVAEACYDADRLVTFGKLTTEEEKEILSLPNKTLARLASDFGI